MGQECPADLDKWQQETQLFQYQLIDIHQHRLYANTQATEVAQTYAQADELGEQMICQYS